MTSLQGLHRVLRQLVTHKAFVSLNQLNRVSWLANIYVLRKKLIENNLTDSGNEELRVQVNTLRYELENIEQERDLTALRHEKEVRDLQARADADFRKAQVNGTVFLDSTESCSNDCIVKRQPRAPVTKLIAK